MFSKTRILSAIVMIATVLIIAIVNNFFINVILFGILLYLAFNEAKNLFSTKNASALVALCIFIIAVFLDKPFYIGLMGVIIILGYLVYKKSDNLKELMPYIYPTLPILMLYEVLSYGGMFVLFWLIMIVVACDSGAYFIGKLIGERAFSPTSPNKTLEGVVGGIVCAGVVGTIIGTFEFSVIKSIYISLIVAIFAVIGDLLESYFKRQAGIKDSGNIIPGHGGILDRIDAVIIAAFAMATLI
ncbi:phosphatidate cytidylyltransferase [Campylobacter insulaenigrae]|uniref:Phosphatidate cytidylyltransferase n=1 Tax=Campylobacter insulaenigrae NCTC 12927 TaxID=1031564 RepID=A0A0A8H682_9BACT|nr:phosphatidate cytidylyltransferase [Campylobacter insulaenigrae]AJC88414.1 CDP-diglyceride synthetase [Campylobacter insulaenigrae NCTC 12927]MCR6591474.1 phosphatidate cytidylyltransferase [Campylobacter insulaenigrae]MCR6593009.1 phosphatidate cytidylyltransferase [Campylobacter insulaenigrae]MCR6594259.1 phosphatidate cytidylyltransferase [Campylobacter insulaenigrae]VEH96082.1 phosphatidate cytidylyltransferase [Campylobacter insulaenigrae]